MRTKKSSPTELSDTRPARHSPEASVTEADDKIRITGDNFSAKAIKLMLKLLPNIVAGPVW